MSSPVGVTEAMLGPDDRDGHAELPGRRQRPAHGGDVGFDRAGAGGDRVRIGQCGAEGGAIEVDKKEIPIDGLLPYVLEKLQQNPEKPVILRTDPDATYGDMIGVFDRLRRANEDWTDDFGNPLYKDVNGDPLIEIKTISIPTQREIENIWNLLGMG